MWTSTVPTSPRCPGPTPDRRDRRAYRRAGVGDEQRKQRTFLRPKTDFQVVLRDAARHKIEIDPGADRVMSGLHERKSAVAEHQACSPDELAGIDDRRQRVVERPGSAPRRRRPNSGG
jgi:hypothetical protein